MNIHEYLDSKGIEYRIKDNELITHCVFSGCDDDSKGKEAHLYFNKNTSQYDCKKCGAQGNIHTLRKHFGDGPEEKKTVTPRGPKFDNAMVERYHFTVTQEIREYLNNRGILDEVIEKYKVGYGTIWGKRYITFPIQNSTTGEYEFFKLRQDPKEGNDKITYPKGEAMLYGQIGKGKQFILEGECDTLALISAGIDGVTSTHGAGTFKEEWIERFKECEDIYVCYDNDEAGLKGTIKVLEMFNSAGYRNTHLVKLPPEIGEKGDVTDFLTKLKYPVTDLYQKYSKVYPEPIDISEFSEMGYDEIVKVLDLTIKKDNTNKVLTLLCLLTAYTENSQFNIMFNGPSSTGKSFTALEVAKLFLSEDLIKLAGASKQSFFHEQGKYDKEKNQMTVDLSRKILIFTDMPHSALLEGLRSFLSHDEKIIYQKITDKDQKGGNRTKTVALKGYPSVIFCTANTHMDFQEQTRFFVLSPEAHDEKVRQGIHIAINKESDSKTYVDKVENDPERVLLKKRIQAIRQAYIQDVNIVKPNNIEERFNAMYKRPQPRHQRDIKRLLSLIKAFAVLNLFWRKRVGDMIEANENDIEQAFKIWDEIAVSQDHNLPPFVYEIYEKILLPVYTDKNKDSKYFDSLTQTKYRVGVTQNEICTMYYQVKGHILDIHKLRLNYLPSLESAGFIYSQKNKDDGRVVEIFPTFMRDAENNSESDCGAESTGKATNN